MTLRKNARQAKGRWIGLGIVVVALMALAATAAFGHGATAIPSNFFTVADQQGVNDVNSEQVDLTQFGRDDTDATKYSLFWSWDSHDSWTGSGQTGDACALFDNDGDGKINFAVCARVANLNANPEDVRLVQQDAAHPVFAFSCSDAKNDRCAQPTGPLNYSSPSDINAGVLTSLAKANLITETDPFAAGEDSPHDTTLQIDILKSFVPLNEVLVNVCSYPSAGNGGNNNPFDCIVNPGGGFLSIVKDAGAGVTSPTFNFSVNTSPATTRSIAGSGTATPVVLGITNAAAVTETGIPSPWQLQNTTACKLADGTTVTGSLDLANSKVTGITIQSGLVTTCTFVDRIPTGTLTVVKDLTNDNGGALEKDDFSFSVDGGTAIPFEADGSNSLTVQAGTYDVLEVGTPITGYDTTYTNCLDVVVPAGGSATCTIHNNDQAATLTVIKHVINDNGGTNVASDWSLDSGGTNDSPDNFAGSEAGTAVTLDAGSYSVSETGPSGYSASYSADCSGTIANGDSKTCTVTNDDQAATLTIIKHVINDNGGTQAASAWTLDSGGTNDSPDNFAGAESPGTVVTLDAGSYNVTESGPSGYAASYSADCSGSIANGDSKTCTVTNDDLKASPGIGTTMKWTLNDSVALTGFRTGGTGGAATFRLYKDDAACGVDSLVFTSAAIAVNNADGTASTVSGYTTEDSGTYRWVVAYSGNNFNDPISSTCGSEVTTLP
jgi:hypothetical protein